MEGCASIVRAKVDDECVMKSDVETFPFFFVPNLVIFVQTINRARRLSTSE